MKKTFTLLAVLTMATSLFAVEIGKPAPDFTGTDINGKTVKLSDYKGKIVVIESYNSDCPFCHNQYASGAAQELQKNLTAKGVEFKSPPKEQFYAVEATFRDDSGNWFSLSQPKGA